MTKGRPIKLIIGIPEYASFPLCGTGQREGDAFTKPFEQFGWKHFSTEAEARYAATLIKTRIEASWQLNQPHGSCAA